MHESLGEKIGEGAFADVHTWAPGRVVKLFKAGVPRRIPWYEARMTRAAFAAGAPAPEVLGEVTVEGRFGIVLPRLDGPTLLELLKTGAVSPAEAGTILARLGHSVHKTPVPPEALPLREYMEGSFRLARGTFPDHIASGILARIDRLPAEDRLCHCDLHPGNVIMTADGPRLIDWTGTKRGGAALDLACSHVILSEITPKSFGDPERQRAVDAVLQEQYAQLAGISLAALRAAIEETVPIVHAFVILGGAAPPALRDRMLQRLEEDLRRSD
jgi:Ser/Thr protein kinase RdoA (MazF antagonist)